MSTGETPEMRAACPTSGPDGGELLPGLQPQACQGLVVDLLRQELALQPAHFLHLPLLAGDVARVFQGDLHLFRHLSRLTPDGRCPAAPGLHR